MNMTEYQLAAARTARVYQNPVIGHLVSALGIGGEAGEVQEILKKVHGHGHIPDRAKLCKELGDVLWYVADIARRNDISLEEVAEENIKKLTGRYPDGFTVDRSVNRRSE